MIFAAEDPGPIQGFVLSKRTTYITPTPALAGCYSVAARSGCSKLLSIGLLDSSHIPVCSIIRRHIRRGRVLVATFAYWVVLGLVILVGSGYASRGDP